MGTGVCNRRQKSLLNTGFCLLAVVGLGSGVYLYNYMIHRSRTSEAQALKFKQQQETLSAQLQVVYEHRSRLERSLQKEKGEHKKTKEDYLVYKLEAQEALNKEKQDSMNRYGALSSQNKILKNQNDDIRKQLSDLQVEQSNLQLEHRKTIEMHNQKLTQLHKEKEIEFLSLQDTISKLQAENKLLRKAYQEVHSQLLGAQDQIEEFRQLKDTLKKMPSFKDPKTDSQNLQFLATNKKDIKGRNTQVPRSTLGREKLVENIHGVSTQHAKRFSQAQPASWEKSLLRSSPVHMAAPRIGSQNDSHVARFTRTVNSLQDHKEAGNRAVLPHVQQPPQDQGLENEVGHDQPGDNRAQTVNVLVANEHVPVHSWRDIVNKVNARMTEEEEEGKPIGVKDVVVKPEEHRPNIPAGDKEDRVPQLSYQGARADDELVMDAGMIDREEILQSQKQHVGQDTLVSEDAADPAKDPNNQGEDEYEEAEINRPEFEEEEEAEKTEKKIQVPDTDVKSREEPEEHYQDDQEQDIV
ncbi:Golgi integral membrane protein 4-like isoform X3 [Pseudophryne corroboree]|uniref:Golgi integral membrane protein 4-like isoform X3 n=1 Tax=Pseudophryne corroboree TaxID=495146 RepID=UPI003081F61F